MSLTVSHHKSVSSVQHTVKKLNSWSCGFQGCDTI